MTHAFKKIGVVILAAGRGSRLGCEVEPKALCDLGGKPILSYILNTLKQGGVPQKQISIVIGYKGDLVKKRMGGNYNYVEQKELLGTAHAAAVGETGLPEKYEHILVLNGDDSAFYRFHTLNVFVSQHVQNNNAISLLTCEVQDPTGMGRVVRDLHNRVVKVVEKERITSKEKNIKEISTGAFCFNRGWFKNKFKNLHKIPVLEEFGLPLFIDEAFKSESRFRAVKLADPGEWLGINTSEELKEAKKRMQRIQST